MSNTQCSGSLVSRLRSLTRLDPFHLPLCALSVQPKLTIPQALCLYLSLRLVFADTSH